ncbi:hypothetical protein FE392_10595 [Xenorhabdus sp. 12]|uniref:Uncharacterized protein n=1 Tax=Xenorhabdus santafensis TaxID=2582833 RepID=A0ABU4SAE0_9GAMM|nr:hypothetical protein [Xenorhabdus sp. 12]MDX7987773.1 hypothetical protein [Xenorhabdus sp. 12]
MLNIIKNSKKLAGTSYNRSPNNQDAVGQSKIISGIPTANNKCVVQFGIYNNLYWNGNSTIRAANNCYSYAVNIKRFSGNKYNFPHPGFCHIGRKPKKDQELIDGVKADGLIPLGESINCPQGNKDNPVWLVALYTGILTTDSPEGEEWDYHFYRKVWTGNGSDKFYWGHKPGSEAVTHVDVSTDYPHEDAKRLGYTNFIGAYLVPNITICGLSY